MDLGWMIVNRTDLGSSAEQGEHEFAREEVPVTGVPKALLATMSHNSARGSRPAISSTDGLIRWYTLQRIPMIGIILIQLVDGDAAPFLPHGHGVF